MSFPTTKAASFPRAAGPMVLPPSGSLSEFAPRFRRGAGVGVLLLTIVTTGALAHVGVRLKGLEVAYDLGRERRIATALEEQRRRLQIEIGMLKDPGRVISIARDKLNMGPPAPEAIRRLGSGSLRMFPTSDESSATAAADAVKHSAVKTTRTKHSRSKKTAVFKGEAL